jgi:hypothetical protein
LAFHPQNFDRAVGNFTKALGIDFQMLDAPDLGLRIAMSLSAGVEIIAPLADGRYAAHARADLEKRGEGLQQMILQVPDLEAGAEAAKAAGWDSGGFRIDCFEASPAWRETYARMREAPLPPIDGVAVTLIEMVPHG